jgi:hypothetical protein
MARSSVIADASALICLGWVDQLQILPAVSARIVVPPAVAAEVTHRQPALPLGSTCRVGRSITEWSLRSPDSTASSGKLGSISTVKLELEDDLLALLQKTNESLEKAARELIVLELYRRGVLSSGKAVEHLGMPRLACIQHASDLGIAYFEMTKDEWGAEKAALEAWPRS